MEKQNECEIVQDLLLNYFDGVLNETSKKFVQNHLKECKKCQEKLDDIKKDIDSTQEKQEKEVDFLKNIKKKMNKKTIFIITALIILAITIIFNLLVFINYSKVACELEIFLSDDITQENLTNIEQIIRKEDNQAEIVYNSKQEALEKMKEKFKENSYLLDGYENNDNPFPASYKVKVKLSSVREIEYNIISIQGVRTVISNIDNNPYELFIMKLFMKDE